MCVRPRKCMTCECRWEERPGEDIRCLGAGATGSVNHLTWLLGTSFGSFGRAPSSLNCWAISPAPMWSFWEWFYGLDYGHCVSIVDNISSETSDWNVLSLDLPTLMSLHSMSSSLWGYFWPPHTSYIWPPHTSYVWPPDTRHTHSPSGSIFSTVLITTA